MSYSNKKCERCGKKRRNVLGWYCNKCKREMKLKGEKPTQWIKGCGKEVGDGMCCGDAIDTDWDYENDVQLVQPIYCKDCWDKVNAMDKVGALE